MVCKNKIKLLLYKVWVVCFKECTVWVAYSCISNSFCTYIGTVDFPSRKCFPNNFCKNPISTSKIQCCAFSWQLKDFNDFYYLSFLFNRPFIHVALLVP